MLLCFAFICFLPLKILRFHVYVNFSILQVRRTVFGLSKSRVTTTCLNFLPIFCLMKWTPGLRTLLQLTMIQQYVRRIQMRSLSTDRCVFINILCGQKWEQSIIDLISDMGKRRVQVWRWGRGRCSEGNCTIGSGNRSFTVRLQAEDASLHGVTDLPPARAHHEILLWFGQAGGAHTERSLHRDRGIQHDGK